MLLAVLLVKVCAVRIARAGGEAWVVAALPKVKRMITPGRPGEVSPCVQPAPGAPSDPWRGSATDDPGGTQ